jgi:hypothetical protein
VILVHGTFLDSNSRGSRSIASFGRLQTYIAWLSARRQPHSLTRSTQQKQKRKPISQHNRPVAFSPAPRSKSLPTTAQLIRPRTAIMTMSIPPQVHYWCQWMAFQYKGCGCTGQYLKRADECQFCVGRKKCKGFEARGWVFYEGSCRACGGQARQRR